MTDSASPTASRNALSVSELNRQVRTLLEHGLQKLWVEGELSNLARPASGHLYFTLKDATAQIRCAWFRQRQRGPTIGLQDGDQLLAYGLVSVYEARGDYQLIVEQLEEAGEGALRRRFEALKRKLAADGLFDEAAKRPLPAVPRCVGVITSPSGAAIRDVLSVLRRRFPAVPVIIYPSAVQGAAAVPELLAALDAATRRAECDVLILARGGGSLEDLWAFNDESLARALRASPIPVVSAVGHEVDFTIADFIADLRAPTPSGAAELVVPDQAEWRRDLARTFTRLESSIRRQLNDRQQSADWVVRRLRQSSPAATVARQRERLASARARLLFAMRHDQVQRARRADQLRARLIRRSPYSALQQRRWQSARLHERLHAALVRRLGEARHRLHLTARALDSVSPLATLQRGYAIVTEANSGALLRDASAVTAGTEIEARLANGRLLATVRRKAPARGDA